MEYIFTKFYGKYIKNIHDFLNSESDLLYINGFSGSGKSSILKKALKEYSGEFLNFNHICFKNSTINDFLISFYDSFREHAIKGKISLKKNPEEAFLKKVNFYFNNLEYKAVVIIDNFEIISDDSEICDFLFHIASLKNVKLIIVSKNTNCKLAENPTIGVERLTFEKIKYEDFKEGFLFSYDIDEDYVKKAYKATEGYELYVKMMLTYIKSANTSIKEYIDEFESKERKFVDFAIQKQISLIPNNYYPLLENFACIHHNVSSNFIKAYSLGDIKQFSYLLSKYAISEFFGTYYIKSYLRKHFSDTLSIQDKISRYSKIISIYKNELEKSLKDRLLRLSREYIRKQISTLEIEIPKVKKVQSVPEFTYITQAIKGNPHWFITENNHKNMSGLNKLRKERDERNKVKEQKKLEEELENTRFSETFTHAIEYINSYEYKTAIEYLKNEVSPHIKNFKQKREVFFKTAECYIKLNDNASALSILRELSEECAKENEINSYSLTRIKIGKIYKKMYALSRAKTCFKEIIDKNDTTIKDKTYAKAHLALGEIYELESNYKSALIEYKKSEELILNSKGEADLLLPEIAYKIGLIYDENGYFDKAYEAYQKSIHYTKISNNDKYLIKAYTSSGLILSDKGNTNEALNSLNHAFRISKRNKNYTESYYIARDIAKVYKDIDPNMALKYLSDALEYAKEAGDSFEVAISLIELGDFYYDIGQNEQALICYFQAKGFLGTSVSKENEQRLTSRIDDMKIKLGDVVFKGMQALYDQN